MIFRGGKKNLYLDKNISNRQRDIVLPNCVTRATAVHLLHCSLLLRLLLLLYVYVYIYVSFISICIALLRRQDCHLLTRRAQLNCSQRSMPVNFEKLSDEKLTADD